MTSWLEAKRATAVDPDDVATLRNIVRDGLIATLAGLGENFTPDADTGDARSVLDGLQGLAFAVRELDELVRPWEQAYTRLRSAG